jgi:hypothetical protein
MKALCSSALVLLLAGCGMVEPGGLFGRPTYVEPEPDPVERPLPPPERFLRLPVNYRFRDDASRKEFLLRMYKDADIEDNVVTVIEEGSVTERLADEEEFAFAMERFVKTWIEKGEEEQLGHFRAAVERERRRSATLLDDLIRFKREAVARLAEELFLLNADFVSTKKTGYRAPAGQAEFLQARMGRIETQLIAEQAELHLLESRRRLRDGDAGLDDLEDLLAE